MHRVVDAHGQRLTNRLRRPLGPDGQEGDVAVMRLPKQQPFLYGELIDVIDHRVDRTAIDGVVRGIEGTGAFRVRNLLHEYHDVHQSAGPSYERRESAGEGS